MGDKNWDFKIRVFGAEDRKTIMAILAMNGYDVGQHKEQRPGGRSYDYYIHGKACEDNMAQTSER